MIDNKQNLIDNLENSKIYWLNKLAGEICSLELTSGFNRPDSSKRGGLKMSIPKEIGDRIVTISKNQDLASYVILLAAFKVVLYKCTGQNDIITVSPLLSSNGQSFNKALAIRDRIEEGMTYKEVLMNVRQTVADAYKNQHYPMDKLMKLLGHEEMESLTRIVVMMDSIHKSVSQDDVPIFTDCDILIRIVKGQDNFELDTSYNSALFPAHYMKKILECYMNILFGVLSNLDVKISDVELVSEVERNVLLKEFNDTSRQYPSDKTIHELFEIQVRKTPDNIAVSCTVDLTRVYDELKSVTTGQGTMKILGKCCFEENPYIFMCKVDVEGYESEYTLLKSHTHNNIIINNNALKLLKLFNKNTNVDTVYKKLKDKRFNLIAYTIPHDDVLEISLELENTKLEIFKNNNEEAFCSFIKVLFNNDIIKFVDYKFTENVEWIDSGDCFDPDGKVPGKEMIDKIFLPDENLGNAEVLLLGDTPGMSTVGLLYLASYLRRNGYSAYCQFTDSNIEYEVFKKNIEDLIDKVQPRIVGVSMKWFVHSSRALETCKILRQHCPEIKIVVGGNTASYYYDNVIKYDCVDYVIKGDGELPLLKICQDADYLPNCCYKKDGEIINNPITYVQDESHSKDIYLSHIDEILISKRATLFGTFYIYTNKGCGLNCLNCASCREGMSKTFNRFKLNMRGIDEIRNDMMITKDYVSTYMFDFESSNEKLLELCRNMWDGIDLSTHFCTFCNVIPPSNELLEYVNKTFKYVYWELDICSLSERHRKHLQSLGEVKPQPSDKEIFEFMDECEKWSNAEVRINLIAGMPFYTEDDMKESNRILEYIMNKYSCFSNLHWARLHAQPGAPVAHYPDKYDMVSYAQTFEDYIKFSDMNMDSRPFYPHLESLFYPYVYYKDEELNSKVSLHYMETNKKLESFRSSKKDNLIVVENLTYKELDIKSSQLANYIAKNCKGARGTVGIMMKYSTDLIVSMLGILKSGGAYLPIDPDYPEERVSFILEKSVVDILLVHHQISGKISFSGQIIDVQNESIFGEELVELGKTSSPTDLAYVIYTSGSTGVPKGVMVEHRSLVNFIHWRIDKYGFEENDRTLQLISNAFDGFGTNFYSSILSGGTLILPDAGHWRDFGFARRLIKELEVTNTSVVPSMFRAILDGAVSKDLESLRFVVLAAEKTDKELIMESKRLNPSIKLINEYGPTENTITTTSLMEMEPDQTSIIGSPIANNRIYILNKYGSLLPIGVQGELCIAGEGLARGYLGNGELSGEKFVYDPFYEGQRMYRTGDLARWTMDGNIEFLGRVDNQVKIRGYRIELGEIESKLKEIKQIIEAAVLLKENENGNKVLCTYFVADEHVEEKAMKEYLMMYLPDYMVPSIFVQLEKMPLNNNGKLDRRALESMKTVKAVKEVYEAPHNEVEKKIANVWQEILGVEKIGINDNFFTSGGDSIKAIQISAKLQKQSIKADVKDIFKFTTIKELSSHVKGINGTVKTQNEIVQGKIGLSPIQEWFFEKDIEDRNHFNQAVMLFAKEGFNETAIRYAFTKIVEQHDALRMIYRFVNGKMEQYNMGLGEEVFSLEVSDLTKDECFKETMAAEAEKLQRSINLEKGPLVKLGLFKTAQGDHLIIIIHHLVVDGISWRIILNDFSFIYDRSIRGEEIPKADKTLSFKAWVDKIKDYAQSKKLLKELEYWSHLEEENIPRLPVDFEAKSNKLKDEKIVGVELDEVETQNLLKGVNRAYNTEINDILLAALGMTVKLWTGEDKVVVNLEGHGREQIIENLDISETVGWFTSQYPVVIDVKNSGNKALLIKTVKEILRKVPNKGLGYGILRYMSGDENVKASMLKLKSEIGFNYLGQFDQDIKSMHFTYSSLSAGTPICPDMDRINTLDVTGLVVDGRLKMNFQYCQNQYKEETVRKLAQSYISSLRDIINHCVGVTECEPTPSDFGDVTLTLTELEGITKAFNEEIVKIYALSPMQEGMLYHSITGRGSDVYFEQSIMTIKGELDPEIYEKSYNLLFERYEILRTAFVYKNLQKPRQVVLKDRRHELYIEDISFMERKEMDAYLDDFITSDRKRGFDLFKDALIRTSIFKIGEGVYKLIWDFHHIIMDGWCLGVIINEFFSIYSALKEGREIVLDEVVPYSNYISWLDGQHKEEAINYWKGVLENYEQLATLPKLDKEKKEKDFVRNEVSFSFDECMTKRLSDLAVKNQVTLSTVLQCLWGILLQRYNNTNDVVYGTVVAGRPSEIPDIEKMAGLFINTIPVRIKCDAEVSFEELIKDVQHNMLSSESYHYSPLGDIQSVTDLKRGLIDHLLAFENYPVKKDEGNSNESRTGFVIDDVEMVDQANYDFNIVLAPEKELIVRLIFNADVYDVEFVKAIEGHLKEVASNVVSNPSVKIKDIRILPQKEVEVIEKINTTEMEYAKDYTIKDLFENQAEKTPENIAIVDGNKRLNYSELNKEANKLAWALKSKGICKDSIVGVVSGNCIETVVGILGILKAGGIYLPIDPAYPKDRIEYMIQDSGTKMLLTLDSYRDKLEIFPQFQGDVISMDTMDPQNDHTANPTTENESDDLAYIIYTSGSTGKPKGVMIRNKGIASLKEYFRYSLGVNENDRIIQFASISFDASVWEMFMALLAGSQLYIVPRDVINSYDSFEEFLNISGITIATLPPTYLANLRPENIKTIRKLVVAGSATPMNLLNGFKDRLDYINAYGPTETTICATAWSSAKDSLCSNTVPIGKPISNTKVYIVNRNMDLQPVMVTGELCVAGDSLAKGYLNRPELTSEKFVTNPLNNEIMYRTGDLARLLPDGNIEFMGRIDNQIKLRGFRIELGEIENHVLADKGVIEAIAQLRGNEEESKYICLYFTAKREMDISGLRKSLTTKLPDYMIPAYFVQLPEMPLTPNGKIDTKRFPSPDVRGNSPNVGNLPLSECEQRIAQIWGDLLKSGLIGVDDNFFEIGGNSLLLIKMYGRLNEIYPGILKVTDIFNNPTISKLAGFVEKNSNEDSSKATKIPYKTLTMPIEYFAGNNVGRSNQVIRASIKDSLFNKIMEISFKENICVTEILFTAYTYLLSRASGRMEVCLQAVIDQGDQVVPVDVDFDKVNSFSDMFKIVHGKYTEGIPGAFRLDDSYRKNSSNNECALLYYDTRMNLDEYLMSDVFDFTLGVTEGEMSIDFVFRFDSHRLRKEKMKVLFDNYMGIVRLIAEKYQL